MNSDKTTRLFRFIALAFALAGVGLLIASWFEYRSTSRFLARTISTTGTIVGNYRSISSRGEASYYPVVQFTTAQGEQLEIRSRTGSSSGLYPIGTEVRVLYTPSNPRDAEFNSWLTQWFGTTILSVLGVGFSGMGLMAAREFSNMQPFTGTRSRGHTKRPSHRQKRGRVHTKA